MESKPANAANAANSPVTRPRPAPASLSQTSIFGTAFHSDSSRQCPSIRSPVRFEGSILAAITRE